MKKSRRNWLAAAVGVVLLVAAAWGYSILNGASAAIDPCKLATVERGAMVRSVVATGKIEPVTKVEIKSKANGIIEKLLVDVDHVMAAGQILAELDKENLTARLREARANLEAAEAALAAAKAQLEKNQIEQRRARSRSRAVSSIAGSGSSSRNSPRSRISTRPAARWSSRRIGNGPPPASS